MNNLKDLLIKRQVEKKTDTRITKGFQFYAYQAANIAGLKNGGRGKLFSIFKQNNYSEFQVKKTQEVANSEVFKKLLTEEAKACYLAGAYRRSIL